MLGSSPVTPADSPHPDGALAQQRSARSAPRGGAGFRGGGTGGRGMPSGVGEAAPNPGFAPFKALEVL